MKSLGIALKIDEHLEEMLDWAVKLGFGNCQLQIWNMENVNAACGKSAADRGIFWHGDHRIVVRMARTDTLEFYGRAVCAGDRAA